MCIVRMFLGIPCPGCGFLHALWFAMHGRWGDSFAVFPVWPAVICYFLWLRRSRIAGKFFVVLSLGQWLVRLL